MYEKYHIMGYRENALYPSLLDEETYSLREAIIKSKEYFRRIRALHKIILLERLEGDKKAPTIALTKNMVDYK